VPKICEVGLPVRYIKDYANGSTANSSSHWVEIQAFSYGKNVALNKTIVKGAINPYPAGNTIDLLLDGITTTTPYVHSNIGYVLIDLEEVYDVQMIKVWHYWGDGRTYYDTKTQVSADGVNWITVFDSAIEGTYKETADGHTIMCRPQNFRINGDITSSGKISGVIYNDYAEYRQSKEHIGPGHVVCEADWKYVALSRKRLSKAPMVVSDVFGFSIGR